MPYPSLPACISESLGSFQAISCFFVLGICIVFSIQELLESLLCLVSPCPTLSFLTQAFLFIACPNCCPLPQAAVPIPVPSNLFRKSCLRCYPSLGNYSSCVKQRLACVLVLKGVTSEDKVHMLPVALEACTRHSVIFTATADLGMGNNEWTI